LRPNVRGDGAVTVKAFFPLYPPIRFHSDAHNDLYYKFVDEFKKPKSVIIRGTSFHDGEKMSVRASPCTPTLQKRFFAQSQFGLKTKDVLQFSGSFRFPGSNKFFFEDQKGERVQNTEASLRSSWRGLLPTFLDVTIQTYLCGLIIAFAGVVTTTGNLWYVGNRVHRFSKHYVTAISHGIDYVRQNDPNLIKELDHNAVIKWIFSQSGMFDGYSNNAASKALNYFTRLFVSEFRNDELSDTVWALAGIEALLVEGGRSSAGQLREKLTALFGSVESTQWLLSNTDTLYDFRSKMVPRD
jgi:hypothetical protein